MKLCFQNVGLDEEKKRSGVRDRLEHSDVVTFTFATFTFVYYVWHCYIKFKIKQESINVNQVITKIFRNIRRKTAQIIQNKRPLKSFSTCKRNRVLRRISKAKSCLILHVSLFLLKCIKYVEIIMQSKIYVSSKRVRECFPANYILIIMTCSCVNFYRDNFQA